MEELMTKIVHLLDAAVTAHNAEEVAHYARALKDLGHICGLKIE